MRYFLDNFFCYSVFSHTNVLYVHKQVVVVNVALNIPVYLLHVREFV